MKNFLQFMVPILVVLLIGFIMFRSNSAQDDDKKLYVKCNGTTKSYEIVSGDKIDFLPDNEACKLAIEAINVSREYIKIGTPSMWRLDRLGEIDQEEAKRSHIVEINTTYVLYSYDQKTKFTFEYK